MYINRMEAANLHLKTHRLMKLRKAIRSVQSTTHLSILPSEVCIELAMYLTKFPSQDTILYDRLVVSGSEQQVIDSSRTEDPGVSHLIEERSCDHRHKLQQ